MNSCSLENKKNQKKNKTETRCSLNWKEEALGSKQAYNGHHKLKITAHCTCHLDMAWEPLVSHHESILLSMESCTSQVTVMWPGRLKFILWQNENKSKSLDFRWHFCRRTFWKVPPKKYIYSYLWFSWLLILGLEFFFLGGGLRLSLKMLFQEHCEVNSACNFSSGTFENVALHTSSGYRGSRWSKFKTLSPNHSSIKKCSLGHQVSPFIIL